jgi:hypothetical protein
MITLSNINSYEPSASLAESVLRHLESQQSPLNLNGSIYAINSHTNFKVMGLDFLGKTCIPSSLGPDFDLAYPTFRDRMIFFKTLGHLHGVDCRPRQPDIDPEFRPKLQSLLSNTGALLEDAWLSHVIAAVHLTHEVLRGGNSYDHQSLMKHCPVKERAEIYPVNPNGLRVIVKDVDSFLPLFLGGP